MPLPFRLQYPLKLILSPPNNNNTLEPLSSDFLWGAALVTVITLFNSGLGIDQIQTTPLPDRRRRLLTRIPLLPVLILAEILPLSKLAKTAAKLIFHKLPLKLLSVFSRN